MKRIIYLFSLLLSISWSAQAQQFACTGQPVTFKLPPTAVGSIQWQDSTVGGTWTDISGATADSLALVATQAKYYRALVTEQNCVNASGVIDLQINQPPTTANAGGNVPNAQGSVTLAANSPLVGTGTWTILSGAGGTLGNAALPNSSFTGTAGNSYTLEWRITNAPCEASADTITVTFDQGPALPSINCLGNTLFIHPTDNAGPTTWGCVGVVAGAGDDNNGELNTSTIVAACTAPTAAGICDGLTAFGFSDWYLPAYNQLLCMRDNATQIGGFSAGGYWSSTEGTGIFTANARYRTFPSGVSGFGSKNNSNRIRCVRD